jgi:hypothetical protein
MTKIVWRLTEENNKGGSIWVHFGLMGYQGTLADSLDNH